MITAYVREPSGFRDTAAALAAGAECCIASLWNVDDAATARLMSLFYDALNDGYRPSAALRAAQLRIREQLPDPYYWAGWVADGATASLASAVTD